MKKVMNKEKKRVSVPLATSMDGPKVAWTMGDLFLVDNRVFLTYHVSQSGFSYLSIIGSAIGAAVLPMTSRYSTLTRLQAAGTGAFMGGATGAALGSFMLIKTAYSENPKIPFDEDGIQMRVNGLSHNYRVRGLDLGTWLGIAAAGATVTYSGGLSKAGLSAGSLGKFQAIGLGSAVGSLLATLFTNATK